MIVKTVKIKGILKTLLTVLVIAAVILAAVYAINRFISAKRAIKLSTEEEMLTFLHDLGWETSETAINIREVTIPSEWNDVYTRYNDLQRQQGFDLDKFRGETASVYSFRILNYDSHPDNMVANLLIREGRLIAADISCTELGGFMQGIAKAENPQS